MHKSAKNRISFGMKLGLSRPQAARLARLKTPEKIQDYVNSIRVNFEPGGDTCLPAAEAMRQRRAHCIEGAFIAAVALWMQGQKPLLLDLKAKGDDDHVVALFRRGRLWGAISKSNHVWLRWRDPIYRNMRELALSYFHEYVSKQSKTLWSYSVPFDLRRFDAKIWVAGRESCFAVAEALDETRHFALINAKQARGLRRRDAIEIRAGKLVDFKRPPKKAARRKKV
jgi:hypothetical protein